MMHYGISRTARNLKTLDMFLNDKDIVDVIKEQIDKEDLKK
jgi:hypothetical protein